MKKNLLLVASLFVGSIAIAQECAAVATLDENFSDFTVAQQNAFPQQCWTANSGSPLMYTAQTADDVYAVYYNGMVPNATGYLVTPELSTIDGNHQLSFDTYRIAMGGQVPAGDVTIQVGTLAVAGDFTTFVAFGDPIAVTATSTNHANIVVTADATQKFIAFRISGTGNHNATAIDNVIWNEVPAPACTAVATFNEDFNDFTVAQQSAFPQNCWSANAGSPLIYTAQTADDVYAVYYNGMVPNAVGYLVSPEVSTLDGNHELSFDTYRIAMGGQVPAGDVTIQVGTLAVADDFTTFAAFGDPIAVTATSETHANIVVTGAATQKYIAFRISGTGNHNATAIDNVIWSEVPAVECTAVADLDENFNEFTDLPENCWSAIAANSGPFLSIDNAEGSEDKYISFYSFTAVNVAATIVTPELTTIGENYTLSFDAGLNPQGAAGIVTVQVGTLTDAADAATFTAIGEPITLTAEMTTYPNIAVTSGNGNFIGFQVSANGAHVAAFLDNVKWQATAGTGDFNKSTFSIFPNPSTDKNVTINHNLEAKGTVNVYTLTGANVFSGELSLGSQNLNLSALSGGVYIVKIQSGNYSESKKLIIQ
ncbi:T9SS type A sorting domain-containing protein [Flavobacterium sp. DG1-102-2]|uniref:T9SS type A sorting domain-containing protein n=1 Tax=Flavobacterium sp. DG1-102-2 TaxID=3081663 RepID=UPI002949EF8B|nr:T9SS type A sorting domain-containing protein [Flavobacterium sp. DG1-102-2]MDV6170194.1 T9SS type A sorting domain-containing protein [Flavobacterium sp. DG1-102-2]